MLKIELTESERQQLQEQRYNHPHPHVMRKMDAVLLKDLGLKNSIICKHLGVCDNTLRGYCKEYLKGGIERLKEVNFYRPSSDMKEFSGKIEDHFLENPPTSISQAVAEIEKLTGLKRGETQVRKFLKSLKFKYIKTASVPAKAFDEEKQKEQREFLEEELAPRLAEAKEGKRTVYFADAAHFVCGAFLGYIWCKARTFVQTLSGRKRYNILGVINAITHDLKYICNETYINAQTVSDLLKLIKEEHMGDINPITIVLDNARYQRCKLVQNLAEELNIELLFLPSYSPNLNLIERYWRWLRKDCLNSKFHENFAKFKEFIDNSLKKTLNKENKKELETLLNLEFQLFDNAIYYRA